MIGLYKENLETGGVKYDQGKLRYDLIPPEVMDSLARVLKFGAEKYADRNWEKGMDWMRIYRAAQGHLLDWQRGEVDPDTGFSHLDHAVCNLAFLVTYESRKIGNDNRPLIKKAV